MTKKRQLLVNISLGLVTTVTFTRPHYISESRQTGTKRRHIFCCSGAFTLVILISSSPVNPLPASPTMHWDDLKTRGWLDGA